MRPDRFAVSSIEELIETTCCKGKLKVWKGVKLEKQRKWAGKIEWEQIGPDQGKGKLDFMQFEFQADDDFAATCDCRWLQFGHSHILDSNGDHVKLDERVKINNEGFIWLDRWYLDTSFSASGPWYEFGNRFDDRITMADSPSLPDRLIKQYGASKDVAKSGFYANTYLVCNNKVAYEIVWKRECTRSISKDDDYSCYYSIVSHNKADKINLHKTSVPWHSKEKWQVGLDLNKNPVFIENPLEQGKSK